ncbi:hypothetical protein BCR36DRAFT_341194 [Piromyces finnis]|uniref:EB domain-containing protein n=1 Tax=Piromyces finnis TaxID=1754191 RepID=A0A1Y1VP35_9FUNG|nr:hypothetical protein BCR36DRAFT_341194 [Piromyces finnis]|eukprot:ORX61030.1 hypothetical protein BCR36DRAFT_341194 [Piromyces finnis]
MLNKKILILYQILQCVNAIYAIVWDKQKVLEIDVEKYRGVGVDDCPEYSQGYIFSNEWFDVCDQNNPEINECYQKVPCKSDNHCLSNKCLNSVCIVNDNSPVIKCMDNYRYDYFSFKGRGKIYCGLSDGEYCKENRECASNECIKNSCVTKFHDYSHDSIIKYIVLAIALLIIVIILICLYCFRSKWKKRNVEVI